MNEHGFKECFYAKEVVNENKSHFRGSLPGISIKRHSREFLSGISTTFKNESGGDPRVLRTATSGMTPYFFMCHAEKPLLSISSAFKKQGGGPEQKDFRASALFNTPSPGTACRPLPQGARGMARGFTLIELLVVVLIIGILAAVALPQYQKAVMKSRLAEFEVNLKSLGDAAKVCKLQNGETCTLDELDVNISSCNPIPGLFENSCEYKSENTAISVPITTKTSLVYHYELGSLIVGQQFNPQVGHVVNQTETIPIGFYCREQARSVEGICSQLGFKNSTGNFSYKYWTW